MGNNTPSPDYAGQQYSTSTYTISNDYLYPGYTRPPMLRQAYLDRGAETNPYKKIGLLRGYIYPIDMISSEVIGGITATSGEDPLTASAKARQEVEDARLAALAAQAGLPTAASAAAAAYAAAGPSSDQTLSATSTDSVKQPKRIRYAEGKQFQFNPMSLSMAIEMNAVAPPETTQTQGTAGSFMVGQGSTGIELYFDRSIETAAASRGRATVNGHKIDPVFADIGVQKDLWDVYRIILGGDKDYWTKIGNKIMNVEDMVGVQMHVQPGSVTDMANRLFDLGASGSKAWGRRVALFFNPNLVVVGDVTSIGFVYAEFNANYVPTKAKIDLGIQILSTTTESGTDAINGADTSTDTTTDPATSTDDNNDDTPAATSTTRTHHTTVVTTGSTTNSHGDTETTYRVAGTNIRLAV